MRRQVGGALPLLLASAAASPGPFAALCSDWTGEQVRGVSGGLSVNCTDAIAFAQGVGGGCGNAVSEIWSSAVGLREKLEDICCESCKLAWPKHDVEVDNEADLFSWLLQNKKTVTVTLNTSISVTTPFWVEGPKFLKAGPGVVMSGASLGAEKTMFNVQGGALLVLEGLTIEGTTGPAVCANDGAGISAVHCNFIRNDNRKGARRLQEERGDSRGAEPRRLSVPAVGEDCTGKATGLHSVTLANGANVTVYCDGDTDGGGWMLLLTMLDVFNQYTCANFPTLHGCREQPGCCNGDGNPYPGSASPFAWDLNADSPSTGAPYSRDWAAAGLRPALGDEFLLKRGTSGDWVRFLQLGPFCGWDQTRNCAPWVDRDTGHGFYAIGSLYDRDGRELFFNGRRFQYFNACTKSGGCMREGTDGVGFGTKENHLRNTGGSDTAFGGGWGPPCLRWNSDDCDSGSRVPYTYWHRRGTKGITETPRELKPCTKGGGAIAGEGGNKMHIVNSSFMDNSAEFGGAMYFKTSAAGDQFTKPKSDIMLSGVTLRQNFVLVDGGGIMVQGTSGNRQVFLTVEDSLVDSNSAGTATERRGGGIAINSGFLTLKSSNVSGNTADIGGGLSLRNAEAKLERVFMSSNLASTRRGFSAGMSIEDASYVTLKGVNTTGNLAIPSNTAYSPHQNGEAIYLGDGALTCESLCPAGTHEASHQASDCADAYYRPCSEPACPLTTHDSSTCTPCGPGTFNPVGGAITPDACIPCAAGTASSAVGSAMPQCTACEAGRFSAAGARECTSCPAGRHASVIGSSECSDCTPGKFAASSSSVECSVCNPGFFSGEPRSTACSRCPEHMSTITAITASAEDCVCEDGFLRLAHGQCEACDTELVSCPGGAAQHTVATLPGTYLALPGADFGQRRLGQEEAVAWSTAPQPWRCASEVDCPGGLEPGECPEGHTGLVCAECLSGYTRSSGRCKPCDGENQLAGRVAFFVLGPLVFVGGLAALLKLAADAYKVQVSIGLALGTIPGFMVTYVQMNSIFLELGIDWPMELKVSVLEVSKVATLDTELLALDCVVGRSPLQVYLPKLLLFPIAFAVVGLLWLAWRKGRAKFAPDKPALSRDTLSNAWGYLLQFAFVPMGVHTVGVFNCFDQPNGMTTMHSIPFVICYASQWWSELFPSAFVAFLFLVVLPYVACVYILVKSTHMEGANARFAFLLNKFRPDVWFWGIVIMSRNLLLFLVPVFAPTMPFVVAVLISGVTLSYLCLMLHFKPWKFGGHNVVDAAMCACFAMTLVSGLAFADTTTYPNADNQGAPSWAFLKAATLLPFILCCVAFLVYWLLGFFASTQKFQEAQVERLKSELHRTVVESGPVLERAMNDTEISSLMTETIQDGFSPHDIEMTLHVCRLIRVLLLGLPNEALPRVYTRRSSLSSSVSSQDASVSLAASKQVDLAAEEVLSVSEETRQPVSAWRARSNKAPSAAA